MLDPTSGLIPMPTVLFLLGVAAAVLAVLAVARRKRDRRAEAALDAPIAAEDFLAGWVVSDAGGRPTAGYKVDYDVPGVYAVCRGDDGQGRYVRAYVGRSRHLGARARSRVTGHGSRVVGEGAAGSARVDLFLVPCREKDMHRWEGELLDVLKDRPGR